MMTSASDVRRPVAAGALALFLITFVCSPAAAQSPSPVLDDWTRYIPADVQLYVEFRDLSIARRHLQRAGLWGAIRELGRLGSPDAAEPPWQERTSQLLGMTAEEAITRILGVRTALLAIDPLRWDRGLVLAELGNPDLIAPLLRRWQAQPREPVGPVACYRLPTGLLLAQRDRLLLFGPESDDAGLWSRTVLLMAGRGGPTLSANRGYRQLSADLPAAFDGLVFLAGPTVAVVLPVPAEAGEERMLVGAIRVGADDLAVDLRARPFPTGPASVPATQPAGPLMPADSVAVWSGTRDFAGLLGPLEAGRPPGEGAPGAVLRWTIAMLSDHGTQVLRSLFGSATLVLGRFPAETPEDFEQPTLTCLLDSRQPEDVARAMDFVVLTLWSWLSDRAASSAEEIPYLKPSLVGDLRIRTVPIGELLARRTRCPFFARLELSWTSAEGRFIVSTSREQLLHVIEALRGRVRRIGDEPALESLMPRAPRDADWLVVRGGPLAAMLRSWLDYVARRAPEALEPAFWSDWAARRIAQQSRLGVRMRSTPDRPNEAEVVEVEPDSPAANYLRPGDAVVRVGGRELTTTQPAHELAERFRASAGARAFALTIRRDGAVKQVSIPLAPPPLPDPGDFDPVAGMKVLIALAEHVETVTLWRRANISNLYDAHVQVRWKPAR